MWTMSGVSVASDIRKQVLASRDRFWRPEDFDGSPDAVAQALSRMACAGEVRRVRRGLYWRGTSTRLGMAPPPPDRLVDAVIDRTGSGPAGWSAALALGLSTQLPRQEVVAVPGRTPRNAGPVRYVSRAASIRRRDERLRPAEVALLEVLRDWDGLVDVPAIDALTRIGRLAGDGTLRLDRVALAAETEPPRVRERLRRLLRRLSRPELVDLIRPARSEIVHADPALAG
jgi:hypothetical protein